jgi:hypothetical protein
MGDVGHQRITVASIYVLHDESYHGSRARGYQLGKSSPIKWHIFELEHLVPSPTIFAAGGNVTSKYWKRRRKRSPQKVSVAINRVMETVTVPVFPPCDYRRTF